MSGSFAGVAPPPCKARLKCRENIGEVDSESLCTKLAAACLFFQPQVCGVSRQVVAAEGLLRTIDDRGNVLGPDSVLSSIANAEQADEVDWWAIKQACNAATRWPELTLSINVSPDQISDSAFVHRFLSLLKSMGTSPHQIELEILEDKPISNIRLAAANIHLLRSHSVSVALDDFGTGCSGFAHLRQLPVSKIKLDRSLIRNSDLRNTGFIVQTVISLANSLGVTVVAEGIETVQQLEILTGMGCQLFQGYLFSPALEAAEFDIFVRRAAPTF